MNRIRNVLIAGWILFVFVIYLLQDHFQLDLWHHLACGRQIARTGRLVAVDTFSHTAAGLSYLDKNWLSQLLFYEVFSLGGLKLLTLFGSGLYATAVTLVVYCCWKRSRHFSASMMCGVLALALSLENMTLRPQAISTLLFVAELFVLWNLSGFWRPAAIALIVALWTNCHGTFTLGIGLPGIFFLAAAIARWRDEGRWQTALRDSSLRSYLLCVGVGLLASFCNPQPAQTFAYVAKATSIAIKLNFQEWQPVRVQSITGIAFLVSIITAFWGFNRSRQKLDLTEFLLLAVFLFLGLKALRMIVWWGFVLAPILAVHLAGVVRDISEKHLKPVSLALFTTVVILTTGSVLPLIKRSTLARSWDEEPRGMVDFLKSTHHLGNVFNTMELGGYLIWHGEDKLKVLVDSRVVPFTAEIFRDYLAVTDGREDWNEILKRYGVETIIASKSRNPRLVRFAKKSGDWKEVHSDPQVTIFKRTR